MSHSNKAKAAVFFICCLFILISAATGCQKAPINGHLDGQWQVMSVEPQPEEVISERIYMCFYMHTCVLTYYGGEVAHGNFKLYDDSLYMDFPLNGGMVFDTILRQYGINSNPVVFSIEELSKNRMILKDDNVTVTLRKF